jgi:uncharacterized phage protein (TIGR01671 family)
MTIAKREIKFRIWDKKTNQFVAGYEDRCDYDEFYADPPGIFFAGLRRVQADEDYTLQQFTGLLDAGEREIYEGDIITFSRLFERERKIKELVSYVKFQDAKFGFDLIGFNDMFYDLSDENCPRVIGNVFENSGLLKKI